MSELSRAVALSGALDSDMLRELTRWRLPIEVPEDAPFSSSEEACAAIEEAITSANQVEVRITDLEVLKSYLQTRVEGKLYAYNQETGEKGIWPLTYGCITRLRQDEYIIPWRSDSVEDLLTNGETHLLTRDKKRVFFSKVQDLYFGEQKSFILCTAIQEDNGKRNKA